jgi:hypothetical protein
MKLFRYRRNCPECDFAESEIRPLEFVSSELLRKINCFGCRQPIFVKLVGVEKE